MRLFSSKRRPSGPRGLLAVASPAAAQYRMDKKPPKNAATPELPHCDRPIGTAAIQEPESLVDRAQRSSPESLLKLFAMRSGCLRIVDRNGGLAMRSMEKGLERVRRSSPRFEHRPRPSGFRRTSSSFRISPTRTRTRAATRWAPSPAASAAAWAASAPSPAASTPRRRRPRPSSPWSTRGPPSSSMWLKASPRRPTSASAWAAAAAAQGGFGAAAAATRTPPLGKVITTAYFNAFVDLIGYMQRDAPTGAQASANAGIQAYSVKQSLVLRKSAAPSAAAVHLHPGRTRLSHRPEERHLVGSGRRERQPRLGVVGVHLAALTLARSDAAPDPVQARRPPIRT